MDLWFIGNGCEDHLTTTDTFIMVSQSHSRSDSKGGCGSTRGRGQLSQCTYCHRLGHTCDRCYQLHD